MGAVAELTTWFFPSTTRSRGYRPHIWHTALRLAQSLSVPTCPGLLLPCRRRRRAPSASPQHHTRSVRPGAAGSTPPSVYDGPVAVRPDLGWDQPLLVVPDAKLAGVVRAPTPQCPVGACPAHILPPALIVAQSVVLPTCAGTGRGSADRHRPS